MGRKFRMGIMMSLCLMAGLPSAGATWSIVAVDPETREVGLAAATCNIGVHFIADIVPEKGVVAAQAATSFKGRKQAIRWIGEGRKAEEILTLLSAPSFYDGWFDRKFPDLQYGVATLGDTASAGFVDGDNLISWSGGHQTNTYSVQGNTLRSEAVVSEAARAFEVKANGACQFTLGERLLNALEAGRKAGGDKRCRADQPSQSAVLLIAVPGAEKSETIKIVTPKEISLFEAAWRMVIPYRPDPGAEDPVTDLRQRFTASGRARCQAN